MYFSTEQIVLTPQEFESARPLIFDSKGNLVNGVRVNGEIDWPRYRVIFQSKEDLLAFRDLTGY